jgi:tryptophan 7-halogenase
MTVRAAPANGAALRSRVAALAVPYGLERSCKLNPDGIFGNRFLLSVHRKAFGHEPLRQIQDVMQPLGLPEGLVRDMEQQLPDADIVHFGYEATASDELCKIYFEFTGNIRNAMRRPSSDDSGVLVHRAWKWRLSPAGGYAATDYVWRRPRPRESMMAAIARLCEPAGTMHPAARAVRSVLQAAPRVVAEALMLLEVKEEGTARRSFDLNLYPAELTVRTVRPAIERLGTEFQIPANEIDLAFAPASGLSLGHVAGGFARDGAPFATIYFGVEAC